MAYKFNPFTGQLDDAGSAGSGSIAAAQDGTEDLPGISFANDLNTGIYRPGDDQVAISTGGTQRINIEADGDINIDSGGVFYDATNNRLAVGTTEPNAALHINANTDATTLPSIILQDSGTTATRLSSITNSSGDLRLAATASLTSLRSFISLQDDQRIIFGQNNNEVARIDTSGRLLVGTSTNTGNYVFQVDSATSTVAQFTRYVSDGARVVIGSSRGTQNSKTTLSNGDAGGWLEFKGYDGSNFQSLAQIGAQCDGKAPAAGDSPGRLVFSTNPGSPATGPTERMRIKSSGIVNVGNTPVYADNTAAKAGGLVDGDIYRKSDGTLMIVYT